MNIKTPQHSTLRAIAALETEKWLKERAESVSIARTPRAFYFHMMKKGVGDSMINKALKVFDLTIDTETFELISLIEYAETEERIKEVLVEDETETDDDKV